RRLGQRPPLERDAAAQRPGRVVVAAIGIGEQLCELRPKVGEQPRQLRHDRVAVDERVLMTAPYQWQPVLAGLIGARAGAGAIAARAEKAGPGRRRRTDQRLGIEPKLEAIQTRVAVEWLPRPGADDDDRVAWPRGD